jgi:dsRNA-specific ribonuclease
LHSGKRYPWAVLARFGPEKFCSDLVESVIGAIFIDTTGDFEQCDAFLERLGLWAIMGRVLRDDVDCLHPKERLGHLAVSDNVEYVKRFHEGKWRCQIKVGGEEVGEEVDGYLRIDVEAEAATQAVIILEKKALQEKALEESRMEESCVEEDRMDLYCDDAESEMDGGDSLSRRKRSRAP